jgi:hypothetical protein
VAGNSRQHRSEKRRKELARQAKQKEKRERKTTRDEGEAGSGPPIDWGEATGGLPQEADRPADDSVQT